MEFHGKWTMTQTQSGRHRIKTPFFIIKTDTEGRRPAINLWTQKRDKCKIFKNTIFLLFCDEWNQLKCGHKSVWTFRTITSKKSVLSLMGQIPKTQNNLFTIHWDFLEQIHFPICVWFVIDDFTVRKCLTSPVNCRQMRFK